MIIQAKLLVMFRKPSDDMVATEVKAKRHETTIAADIMALKKAVSLVYFNCQLRQHYH